MKKPDGARREHARSRSLSWVSSAAELALLLTSLVYVITSRLEALLVWESLAVSYLIAGLAVTWKGQPTSRNPEDLEFLERWSWLLPLISGLAGSNSAILALGAQDPAGLPDQFLAVAASIGVVVSWTLLQVGFAQMYQAINTDRDHPGIRFPEQTAPVNLDYLYFAFTVGAAFATSDAQVTTVRMRRIVMIHSIISFFYNALVVAVAFQVLQQILAT